MKRGPAIALAVGLLLHGSGALPASPAGGEVERTLPEYVVKAGLLYNLAKYVDWPSGAFARPDAPIAIGIVGEDPFGEDLEQTLGAKSLEGRRFVFHRYRSPAEIERCHILFVARSEEGRLPEILQRIEAWPVLTVGEAEDFSREGGATAILIENDKPRLEVNPDAVAHAKLMIDAKLLRVATIVRSGARR